MNNDEKDFDPDNVWHWIGALIVIGLMVIIPLLIYVEEWRTYN
jgi:hypothetical protein